MLGRKNYSREEIDHGKAAVGHQLAAYKTLTKALPDATAGKHANAARESFDTEFFNNLTLVMDRYFVHRLAGPNYEGKDGNPLNEVRLICDSLITNNGVMQRDKQITLLPERSVAKFDVGDEIKMTQNKFEKLSAAFFAELERRFL